MFLLTGNEIYVMEWPSQSLYINLIENWRRKLNIKVMTRSPSNLRLGEIIAKYEL